MNLKVSKLREKVANLKAQIARLETLPTSKEFAAAQLDDFISAAEHSAASHVQDWLRRFVRPGDYSPDTLTAPLDRDSVAKLVIALNPNAREWFRSLLEHEYDGAGETINPNAIAETRARLANELMQAERADYLASIEYGIPPRADTNAHILLAL